MTLLDTIQTLVAQVLSGSQLTDMAVGTVTSADPLEIQLDTSQAPIKSDIIILTDAVKPKSVGQFVITTALAAGEKVLLLSVQHGQKFIVLSRL